MALKVGLMLISDFLVRGIPAIFTTKGDSDKFQGQRKEIKSKHTLDDCRIISIDRAQLTGS